MAKPYAELMPIYPLLAQQFVDDYGITRGRCLDIGTGHGFLGIEVAKITELEMFFIDIDNEALQVAEANAAEAELENNLHFIKAYAENLPFANDFADLIISRGSLWFWEDKVKGLQEVYRVLKPGGTAIVGGGLGRYIPSTMRSRLKASRREWLAKRGEKRPSTDEMKALVSKTGITSYQLLKDAPGEMRRWIEIHKRG